MALSKVGKNQVDQSASLTVDSDLTVDTNTLVVDSTNNRVGIGDNNPTQALSVGGHIKVDAGLTGYILGPTGEMLVGEDGTGFFLGTGFGANPNIPFYIGHANTASYNFRMGGSGGGNNVLAIDSSGRVTMPYQPAFCAQASGGYQTTSPIPFTSAKVNTGGHFNTSTYLFTAPIAGRYLFTLHIYFDNNTSADGYPRFVVNGSYNHGYAYMQGNSDGDKTSSMTTMISLAAGDSIQVTYSGGGLQYYGGADETQFTGFLIG